MLHTALDSYRCLRKEGQMSLHEGGTNTGAIEWDSFSKAWREPGKKRQASGSVTLLQSASMLFCCTPETCSLYVPKGILL